MLERLSFVEVAKHVGLSLTEIVDLVAIVDTDSCSEVRDAVQPRLHDRLDEVDRQLAGLRVLRRRLVEASTSVAACPDSSRPRRSECLLGGSPGHGHEVRQ